MRLRNDPGDCLICGAPHCSCDGGPIEVVQLPARDAAQQMAVDARVLVADRVQATLPPGQVTSGTYRRTKAKS